VDELTMTYEVRRHTTFMKVTGVVDADRSADFDDGLEVARTLRRRGPIVVDLSGVEAIAASALLSLMRTVQESERSERALTVRGLFPTRILTSRLVA
jgi:anti-anti-sigma regulatory factor